MNRKNESALKSATLKWGCATILAPGQKLSKGHEMFAAVEIGRRERDKLHNTQRIIDTIELERLAIERAIQGHDIYGNPVHRKFT